MTRPTLLQNFIANKFIVQAGRWSLIRIHLNDKNPSERIEQREFSGEDVLTKCSTHSENESQAGAMLMNGTAFPAHYWPHAEWPQTPGRSELQGALHHVRCGLCGIGFSREHPTSGITSKRMHTSSIVSLNRFFRAKFRLL